VVAYYQSFIAKTGRQMNSAANSASVAPAAVWSASIEATGWPSTKASMTRPAANIGIAMGGRMSIWRSSRAAFDKFRISAPANVTGNFFSVLAGDSHFHGNSCSYRLKSS
jgi:hypothetical protein